jgi:hypothetical protein
MLSTERYQTLRNFVCGLNGRVRTRQHSMAYPLPHHYAVDRHGHISLIFEFIRVPITIYLRDLYVACLGNPFVLHPRQEFDNIVQEVFLRLNVQAWEPLELAYHAFFADAWVIGHCHVLGARNHAKYARLGWFPTFTDAAVVFKYSVRSHA